MKTSSQSQAKEKSQGKDPMKTPKDPRHKKRRKAVQALFSFSFGQEKPATELSEKVKKSVKEIDSLISQSAPQWPIEKINKIDLAILRLAVWELTLAKQPPPKVVIDEAIELSKEFGGEKSPEFVNGVLGDILNKIKKQNPKESK